MVWLQSAVPLIGILLLFQRTTALLIPQQYHLINGSLTWYEAQSFCRLKYTDLATVNNMDDKNRLVNVLGSHVTYSWIGLQRGHIPWWMWSDGRGKAHFTKWNTGEPNGGDNQQCGQMLDTGLWNDVPCGDESGFVCYERGEDGMERYVLYSGKRSWENSQELCRIHHTDMASVSSAADNAEIDSVASTVNPVWIGLFRETWKWSDGGETSFRYWLRGSESRGDCASVAVSQQGRWVEAQCNEKSTFVCQGGLKVKRMIIKLKIRSDVDLTDSTVTDALLKKLETGLRRQWVTDFNLRWRSDNNGHVFQREQLEVAKKTGC